MKRIAIALIFAALIVAGFTAHAQQSHQWASDFDQLRVPAPVEIDAKAKARGINKADKRAMALASLDPDDDDVYYVSLPEVRLEHRRSQEVHKRWVVDICINHDPPHLRILVK